MEAIIIGGNALRIAAAARASVMSTAMVVRTAMAPAALMGSPLAYVSKNPSKANLPP